VPTLIAVLTLVGGPLPVGADDVLEWAGDWVIWEGNLTGEEAWLRLEPLETALAGFEADLPAWAERLRSLCDVDGRLYRGIAGYGSVVDPASDIRVLACDARTATAGWSPPFLVVGAMSGHVSPLDAGSPDLSLFGLGAEPVERAPFTDSPSDHYFWGATIIWTPTADNPQGSRAITGPGDWHGRCMAGPCAPGAVVSSSTTVARPTLEQQKSRIGIENPGRDCDIDDQGYRIGLVKTPYEDFNFLTWSSLPVVTQASAGAEVIIPEGYVVAALGLGADGRLREIVAEGPSTLTLPCRSESGILRFLTNINPFGTATTLPGRVLTGTVGLFVFPWDLPPGEQAEQACGGDDPPVWCYRPVMGTPMVTTAVLGTALFVEVTEVDTRVVVLEGSVLVTGVEAGQEVVDAGYAVTSDGTSVGQPQPVDVDDLKQQHRWLADALAAEVDLPDLVTGDAATYTEGDGDGVDVLVFGVVTVLAAVLALLLLRRRRAAHDPPPLP
jgi:hypothetical protein